MTSTAAIYIALALTMHVDCEIFEAGGVRRVSFLAYMGNYAKCF